MIQKSKTATTETKIYSWLLFPHSNVTLYRIYAKANLVRIEIIHIGKCRLLTIYESFALDRFVLNILNENLKKPILS